jgi:hypothetical protein
MELSQTSTKEKNMLEIVFDPSQPLENEKRALTTWSTWPGKGQVEKCSFCFTEVKLT